MRNFQSDLNKGILGEQLLLKLFKGLTSVGGRKHDLTAPDGSKIELKVDFYGMNKSPNFFMERYGAVETGADGGPWKARNDNCKYFIYFYAHELAGFVWKTDELIEQLEKLSNKLTPVNVRNKSWTTVGFKVDRKLLLNACVATFTAKTLEISNELAQNELSTWDFKPLSR